VTGIQALLTQTPVLLHKQVEHKGGMAVNQGLKVAAPHPNQGHRRQGDGISGVVFPEIHQVLKEEDLSRSITDSIVGTISEFHQALVHPINRGDGVAAAKDRRAGRKHDPIRLVLRSEKINGAGLGIRKLQCSAKETTKNHSAKQANAMCGK
jgi:hypothetical protein